MADTLAIEEFRQGYLAVLDTVVARSEGYFLEPGASLFEILAAVSAAEASRPVGGHGATLAAQVDHLRFYFAARNEEVRGGTGPTDWATAWQTGAVTDDEWRALLARLRAEYEAQRAFALAAATWDRWAISDAFALVGHCAYHLGEIRLTLGLLAGKARRES